MNLGYLLGFPTILDLRALIDRRSSEYLDFTITHVPLWQWFEGKVCFLTLLQANTDQVALVAVFHRPRDNRLFSSYSYAV